MARPCAADASPSPPEATPEVQTTREEDKARWIDVISRDLVGVTNWQEVVKERAKWRAVVRSLTLSLCSIVSRSSPTSF